MKEHQKIIIDRTENIANFLKRFSKHIGVDVNHDGKSNHILSVEFDSGDKPVDYFFINTKEFELYAYQVNSPDGQAKPEKFQLTGKKKVEWKIPITKTTRLHFLMVKRAMTSAPVKVVIKEKWNSRKLKIEGFSGIPISNNQLTKEIKKMMLGAKKRLWIISAHYDLHIIEEITTALNNDVEVKLIVKKKDSQHGAKRAFSHFQRLLKDNFRQNEDLHSRLMIKDDSEVLIMTSDINQDSMQHLINYGIKTSESGTVIKASEFFEEVWAMSKNTATKKQKEN